MRDSIAREALRAAYAAAGSTVPVSRRVQTLMGGTGQIVLFGASDQLVTECFELADRCETLWSRFLLTSDITRINWAAGRFVLVDPLTIRLVEAMEDASRMTSGDFNPTILPDLVASGYAVSVVDQSRRTRLPLEARRCAQWRVEIHGRRLRLPVGATLDPGGIGKGLAADIVVEFAMSHGAWGALAEFGGDIVVDGEGPAGEGWPIAVDNGAGSRTPPEIIRIGSGAVATSSQLKRRWTQHGSERHHLIDPLTGRQAITATASVTVIASAGARAEAICKSAFLRATHDYLQWVPSIGAAAQTLLLDGTIRSSENWEQYR